MSRGCAGAGWAEHCPLLRLSALHLPLPAEYTGCCVSPPRLSCRSAHQPCLRLVPLLPRHPRRCRLARSKPRSLLQPRRTHLPDLLCRRVIIERSGPGSDGADLDLIQLDELAVRVEERVAQHRNLPANSMQTTYLAHDMSRDHAAGVVRSGWGSGLTRRRWLGRCRRCRGSVCTRRLPRPAGPCDARRRACSAAARCHPEPPTQMWNHCSAGRSMQCGANAVWFGGRTVRRERRGLSGLGIGLSR